MYTEVYKVCLIKAKCSQTRKRRTDGQKKHQLVSSFAASAAAGL